MAKNDAFTAGVRPGGLTDSTEIRLLLCYLIQNAGPLKREELENALLQEQLVNYFEISSGLEELLQRKLVEKEGEAYAITENGRKVASELAYDLPRSVREKAMIAVLRTRTWNQKSRQYSAEVAACEEGRCQVVCSIRDLDKEEFSLCLTVPDQQTAELVARRFTLHGNEIYAMLINKLAEDSIEL